MLKQLPTTGTDSEQIQSILNFLHHFPRFLSTPENFSPYDAHYQQYLHYIVTLSCAVGFAIFLSMLILLLRRWKFAQTDALAFRYAFSADMPAVLLLGITALSAFAGLLGEAKVDFAVQTTHKAIFNSTELFQMMHNQTHSIASSVHSIDASSDDFIVAYGNTSHFPTLVASNLAQTTTQLRQKCHDLSTIVNLLPSPTSLRHRATQWRNVYKWVQGSTNFIIAGISTASVIGIIAIGWSLSSCIKWSLLITLWTIPMAHTLVGLYLSGAIAGADFCVDPAANTMLVMLNGSNASVFGEYYLTHCNSNTSVYLPGIDTDSILHPRKSEDSPFSASLRSMQRLADASRGDLVVLSDFADKYHHKEMQREFLSPMYAQLESIQHELDRFGNASTCSPVHAMFERATTAFCQDGVIGAFSLWIHQMTLCLLLLLCVVCTACVWERVEARDVRLDRHYQLLGSYEEDQVEHVYLTPE